MEKSINLYEKSNNQIIDLYGENSTKNEYVNLEKIWNSRKKLGEEIKAKQIYQEKLMKWLINNNEMKKIMEEKEKEFLESKWINISKEYQIEWENEITAGKYWKIYEAIEKKSKKLFAIKVKKNEYYVEK